MSNKIALFILCMLFLVGCAAPEATKEKVLSPVVEDVPKETVEIPEIIQEQQPAEEIQELVQPVDRETTPSSQELGALCSGEEECLAFCEHNPGECEGYCLRNTENLVCQTMYTFEDGKLRKKIKIPEEKPVLSLPFNEEDEAIGILPMGETISHNGGPHAGMDLFWDKDAKIRNSLDGEIVYIDRRKPEEGEFYEGMWDIFVRTGVYVIGYTELDIVNPDAYLGKMVRKGEWLGNPNNKNIGNWMTHWEFGYYPEGWQGHGRINPKPHPDRLCPMSYFDENSRQRIEEIWDKAVWDHRAEFPDICSGVFEGKDE